MTTIQFDSSSFISPLEKLLQVSLNLSASDKAGKYISDTYISTTYNKYNHNPVDILFFSRKSLLLSYRKNQIAASHANSSENCDKDTIIKIRYIK